MSHGRPLLPTVAPVAPAAQVSLSEVPRTAADDARDAASLFAQRWMMQQRQAGPNAHMRRPTPTPTSTPTSIPSQSFSVPITSIELRPTPAVAAATNAHAQLQQQQQPQHRVSPHFVRSLNDIRESDADSAQLAPGSPQPPSSSLSAPSSDGTVSPSAAPLPPPSSAPAQLEPPAPSADPISEYSALSPPHFALPGFAPSPDTSSSTVVPAPLDNSLPSRSPALHSTAVPSRSPAPLHSTALPSVATKNADANVVPTSTATASPTSAATNHSVGSRSHAPSATTTQQHQLHQQQKHNAVGPAGTTKHVASRLSATAAVSAPTTAPIDGVPAARTHNASAYSHASVPGASVAHTRTHVGGGRGVAKLVNAAHGKSSAIAKRTPHTLRSVATKNADANAVPTSTATAASTYAATNHSVGSGSRSHALSATAAQQQHQLHQQKHTFNATGATKRGSRAPATAAQQKHQLRQQQKHTLHAIGASGATKRVVASRSPAAAAMSVPAARTHNASAHSHHASVPGASVAHTRTHVGGGRGVAKLVKAANGKSSAVAKRPSAAAARTLHSKNSIAAPRNSPASIPTTTPTAPSGNVNANNASPAYTSATAAAPPAAPMAAAPPAVPVAAAPPAAPVATAGAAPPAATSPAPLNNISANNNNNNNNNNSSSSSNANVNLAPATATATSTELKSSSSLATPSSSAAPSPGTGSGSHADMGVVPLPELPEILPHMEKKREELLQSGDFRRELGVGAGAGSKDPLDRRDLFREGWNQALQHFTTLEDMNLVNPEADSGKEAGKKYALNQVQTRLLLNSVRNMQLQLGFLLRQRQKPSAVGDPLVRDRMAQLKSIMAQLKELEAKKKSQDELLIEQKRLDLEKELREKEALAKKERDELRATVRALEHEVQMLRDDKVAAEAKKASEAEQERAKQLAEQHALKCAELEATRQQSAAADQRHALSAAAHSHAQQQPSSDPSKGNDFMRGWGDARQQLASEIQTLHHSLENALASRPGEGAHSMSKAEMGARKPPPTAASGRTAAQLEEDIMLSRYMHDAEEAYLHAPRHK